MGVFKEITNITSEICALSLEENASSLSGIKYEALNRVTETMRHLIEKKEKLIIENEEAICVYSSFNLDDFGYVLSRLISYVEDDSYEYYETNYNSRIFGFGPNICSLEDNKTLYVVGKTIDKKSTIFEEFSIDDMSKSFYANNDIIILGSTRDTKPEEINLFNAFRGISIVCKDKPYIEEFIVYLLDYKFKNKISDLSLEDLESLLDTFINKLEKDKKAAKIISKKR